MLPSCAEESEGVEALPTDDAGLAGRGSCMDCKPTTDGTLGLLAKLGLGGGTGRGRLLGIDLS